MKLVLLCVLLGLLGAFASDPGTLKEVICKLGAPMGLKCDSVVVSPVGSDLVEVKFTLGHQPGSVVLTSGCKVSAPAIYEFVRGVLEPAHKKENVIELFTNPKLLKEVTSNKCTIVKAKVPLELGGFVELECPESSPRCISFTTNLNGVTSFSMLNGPRIRFPVEVEDSPLQQHDSSSTDPRHRHGGHHGVHHEDGKSASSSSSDDDFDFVTSSSTTEMLELLVRELKITFDFRTATVPERSQLRVELIEPPSDEFAEDIQDIILYTIGRCQNQLREVLVHGEPNTREVSLWPVSSKSSSEGLLMKFLRRPLANLFRGFNASPRPASLKDVICKLGERVNLNCDTIRIVPIGSEIEVKFSLFGQNGLLVLSSGCKSHGPALYEFLQAALLNPRKENIVRVFTDPQLLGSVSSNKCNLVYAYIPLEKHDQFFELSPECLDLICTNFDVQSSGRASLDAHTLRIAMPWPTQSSEKTTMLRFRVHEFAAKFDFRTATVPSGAEPTIRLELLQGSNSPVTVDNLEKSIILTVQQTFEMLRNLLVAGESSPNDVSLWPRTPKLVVSSSSYMHDYVRRFLHAAPMENEGGLKKVICKLGSPMGLNCDTLDVKVVNNLVEVSFSLFGQGGRILLTKGCKSSAPAIFELIHAVFLDPSHMKENVINLFTNLAMVSEISSDKCTLMKAYIPTKQSGEFFDIECPNSKCVVFGAKPNGRTFLDISELRVQMPFKIRSTGHVVQLKLRLIELFVEFDFRTVKVLAGSQPRVRLELTQESVPSVPVEKIKQDFFERIGQILDTVRTSLLKGEANPNEVSLWPLATKPGLSDLWVKRACASARDSEGGLKKVICKLGSPLGLNCDTLDVKVVNNLVEVSFLIFGQEGRILLTKGCKSSASAIFELIRAVFLDPSRMKENVINLFTDPAMLSAISSDKCTVMKAYIPTKQSGQFFDIECPNSKCVVYGAKPNGRTFLDISELWVKMPLKIRSTGQITQLNFRIIDLFVEFDFRTVTVPAGSQPRVRLELTQESVPSVSVEQIKQQIFRTIGERFGVIQTSLLKGETNPKDVSLWPLVTKPDSWMGREVSLRENSLKTEICNMGEPMGLSCKSVAIVLSEAGDRVEVHFTLYDKKGSITFTSGCKNNAQAVSTFLRAILHDSSRSKENIIKLFADPQLLKGVSSNKCTLVQANIPLRQANQFLKIECPNLQCISFGATPNGCVVLDISDLRVSMPWEVQSTGKIAQAKFRIHELFVEFDFRTATRPANQPRVHVELLDSSDPSLTSGDIKQEISSKIITRLDVLRAALVKGEANPNDASLWPLSSKPSFSASWVSRGLSRKSSLNNIICEMGSPMGLDCQSIEIVTDGDRVEVRFMVNGKKGTIVLTSGCKNNAQPIHTLLRAVFNNQTRSKENIINLFSNLDLVEGISSDQCTVAGVRIPSKQDDKLFEIECPNLRCVSFGAKQNGRAFVHLRDLRISMPWTVQSSGKLTVLKFRVHEMFAEFDFRTATVPHDGRPRVHIEILQGSSPLVAVEDIKQMILSGIGRRFEMLQQLLTKGEPNPENVMLWAIPK